MSEKEILEDYLKAIDLLTINSNNVLLNKQLQKITEEKNEHNLMIQREMDRRAIELEKLRNQKIINKDSITLLSDQIALLVEE